MAANKKVKAFAKAGEVPSVEFDFALPCSGRGCGLRLLS